MKKKTETKNEIFIHVKAESEILSVNAIIPEDACVPILVQLRNNFNKLNERHKNKHYLKVQTCVHNPKIF